MSAVLSERALTNVKRSFKASNSRRLAANALAWLSTKINQENFA